MAAAAAEAAARGMATAAAFRSEQRRWTQREISPRGAQEVPFDFGGFDFSDFARWRRARLAAQQAESGGGGFGGSFKDIFSGMFQGGQKVFRRSEPQPGTDLEYQVSDRLLDCRSAAA